MIIMTDTLYLNDEYLKAKKFSDLLVIINLLKGREKPRLRLQGLVLCTAVDTKHDHGWSQVSVISGIPLWHRSSHLLESVFLLASDSASCYNKTCWLYTINTKHFLTNQWQETKSLSCCETCDSAEVTLNELELEIAHEPWWQKWVCRVWKERRTG